MINKKGVDKILFFLGPDYPKGTYLSSKEITDIQNSFHDYLNVVYEDNTGPFNPTSAFSKGFELGRVYARLEVEGKLED